MDSLLEVLQFRTAIPFGYVAFLGFLCLVSFTGLSVFVLGCLRHRKPKGKLVACVGWLVFCSSLLVFGANLLFEARLDFTPSDVSAKSLAGTWKHGKTDLRLLGD